MRNFMSIDGDDAQLFLDTIWAAARNDKGPNIAICVVDIRCHELRAAAMDDVVPSCVGYARAKAITALNEQIDTVAIQHVETRMGGWKLEDELVDSPADVGFGISSLEREAWSLVDIIAASKSSRPFSPWAGGVRILSPHDASILGAVGVSGRRQVEDHRLASLLPSGWSA